MKLFISWAEDECASCAENLLCDKFKDSELLNEAKPPKCKFHHLKPIEQSEVAVG